MVKQQQHSTIKYFTANSGFHTVFIILVNIHQDLQFKLTVF